MLVSQLRSVSKRNDSRIFDSYHGMVTAKHDQRDDWSHSLAVAVKPIRFDSEEKAWHQFRFTLRFFSMQRGFQIHSNIELHTVRLVGEVHNWAILYVAQRVSDSWWPQTCQGQRFAMLQAVLQSGMVDLALF